MRVLNFDRVAVTLRPVIIDPMSAANVTLLPIASQICRDRQHGGKNGELCNGCPLREQCHAPCGAGREALNRHTAAVNDAALRWQEGAK